MKTSKSDSAIEDAAAEILKLSSLPIDGLADLWEAINGLLFLFNYPNYP
jgi:hypothetical protein